MLKVISKKINLIIIVVLVLALTFINIRTKQYKEFISYSITTSFTNIIGHANELTNELESIADGEDILKDDLNRIIYLHSLLINELYYIETSIGMLSDTETTSFYKYDILQDLRVKVHKTNSKVISLNHSDMEALRRLNDISENILNVLTWEDENILDSNVWIKIVEEVHIKNSKYLRRL